MNYQRVNKTFYIYAHQSSYKKIQKESDKKQLSFAESCEYVWVFTSQWTLHVNNPQHAETMKIIYG